MAQPFTIKSGDERNDVTPAAPKGYSTFNLSHIFLQTHRFAEIAPTESFEVIKGDKISLRLQSDTSSYSLKAPIKTDMFKKSSNFFVPLQAIIRNNWELVTAQPNSGDDVPVDADGVVSAQKINSFFETLLQYLTDLSLYTSTPYLPNLMTKYLRSLLTAEMFFSQGSLCKQLYYDFSHCLYFIQRIEDVRQKIVSFDKFADFVLSKMNPVIPPSSGVREFTIRFYDEEGNVTDSYSVLPESLLVENSIKIDANSNCISFRHCLDLCRQNLNFKIENVVSSLSNDVAVINEFFFGDFLDVEDSLHVLSSGILSLTEDINFDKLAAYQIVCAHFFSLDHVDYIYSAELYRQLMQYYVDKCYDLYSLTADQHFSWNGLELNYDALSGRAIGNLAFRIDNFTSSSNFEFGRCYLTALFSFRHSLRYLDYFTGGRTKPLSVGTLGDQRADVSVPVVSNSVNAVDMVLAQNAARYLNFAQRAGRKISKWLEDLFPGGQPKVDFHDPQWLSSVGDPLEPQQTQNTGQSQVTDANSITARFKNDSNRFMYQYEPDRPGYMISVAYYDVPRAYAFATAKENMHRDRYDRFNPFFQFNGSQAVKCQELGIPGDDPFSYQNRYEEYKQNYGICAGGFVENLPGFAFIADVQSGLPMQSHLNPTYVRSWNVELDPFYLALTGFCLASYFHFIVKNVNIIQGQRPMEYAPNLM